MSATTYQEDTDNYVNEIQNALNPAEESSTAHYKVYTHRQTAGVSDEDLGNAAAYEAFEAFQRSGGCGGLSKLNEMVRDEVNKIYVSHGGHDKNKVLQLAKNMAKEMAETVGHN
ncbi:hypothetical protein BGX29_000604 [Mortierella sp. GBA35]|nr:hypothetical protein BGX23_011835 [Mortierella sp. AD031]KAF9087799.1 hypothetical protein BGX29_000604 [Mortierella sp. GBA35]KAG0211585.1 hypothetical protein BGX33_004187 [Mortierella sp. NVP41]